MFLLLFSIDENEVRGKRVRKKITRRLKTKLAEFRNENPTRYLEIVNDAQGILEATKAEYHAKGNTELGLDPSAMLNLLHFRYPEDVAIFNILYIDRKHLHDAYKDIRLTWTSIKYTNILVKQVYKYFGEEPPKGPEELLEEVA
jgi:hypothetical protein